MTTASVVQYAGLICCTADDAQVSTLETTTPNVDNTSRNFGAIHWNIIVAGEHRTLVVKSTIKNQWYLVATRLEDKQVNATRLKEVVDYQFIEEFTEGQWFSNSKEQFLELFTTITDYVDTDKLTKIYLTDYKHHNLFGAGYNVSLDAFIDADYIYVQLPDIDEKNATYRAPMEGEPVTPPVQIFSGVLSGVLSDLPPMTPPGMRPTMPVGKFACAYDVIAYLRKPNKSDYNESIKMAFGRSRGALIESLKTNPVVKGLVAIYLNLEADWEVRRKELMVIAFANRGDGEQSLAELEIQHDISVLAQSEEEFPDIYAGQEALYIAQRQVNDFLVLCVADAVDAFIRTEGGFRMHGVRQWTGESFKDINYDRFTLANNLRRQHEYGLRGVITDLIHGDGTFEAQEQDELMEDYLIS